MLVVFWRAVGMIFLALVLGFALGFGSGWEWYHQRVHLARKEGIHHAGTAKNQRRRVAARSGRDLHLARLRERAR